MRKEIHPEYHTLEIECVCGAKFDTKSTKEFNKVDICSHCHPFYTGKQKVVDTEGRIEKFKKKYGDTFAQLKKKK